MAIPRNEMGHRYYTDFHIRLFKQIKELKEKGYQLKAIKAALASLWIRMARPVIPTDVLEEDVCGGAEGMQRIRKAGKWKSWMTGIDRADGEGAGGAV